MVENIQRLASIEIHFNFKHLFPFKQALLHELGHYSLSSGAIQSGLDGFD